MTFLGWAQIALFCVIIVALTRPLGGYMTRLFAGERTFLSPVLGPVERGFYRAAGVDGRSEQHWVTYGLAMLAFNAAGFFLLYALQRLQGVLPLNPQGMVGTSPHLSFNTAVSFVTNTNWQSYGGESTLGYLVQMAGLTVQNFVSAATGIALAVALVRGFTPHRLEHDRQLLGRPGPLHALPAAAALHSAGAVLRLAGRAAEPRSLRRGDHARRRPADDRAGAGGLAAGDQDAGHQWRRLLQRQLGASLREPDGTQQFRADHHDLRDRCRPHQPVRPHGRRRAPGLGDPGRHGRPVPGRCRRRLLGRGAGQPGPDRARRRRLRAATWRARRSASASPPRRCSR